MCIPRAEPLESRTLFGGSPPAAGALDPTFGTAGRVITPIPRARNFSPAAVAAVDKHIYVGGLSNLYYALEVHRLNLDGSVDSTYGVDGTARVAIDSKFRACMAVEPDGQV